MINMGIATPEQAAQDLGTTYIPAAQTGSKWKNSDLDLMAGALSDAAFADRIVEGLRKGWITQEEYQNWLSGKNTNPNWLG